jgi:GH18 family chitinase
MNPFQKRTIILGFVFVFTVTAFSLQAQTNSFRIIGYVPNWIDVNTFALNFDYKKVTHLNYAFQNPDVSGNLAESNNGLTTLVAKAHQNNVKVLISIGGGSAAGDPVKTYYQNLITTAEKRAVFISKILAYIKRYQLDGLDVDEEGPAINSNYDPFIKQLVDSLKPKGLLLTAAVGWGGESIPNKAFQYFDFINLMSYDLTGNWDLKNPGQHSPYWYAGQMISDYKKRGVKKEQLCLGVPFYGYGFYKAVGSFPYSQILAKYPDAWNKDQVGDTIYYNGMNTIRKKTKLALSEVSGIMIWELSNDAKGDKSLLSVISSTVDSLKTTPIPVLTTNEFRVYPNPAHENLYIENIQPDQKAVIRIYSVHGCLEKIIHIRRNHEAKILVDISGMKNGTYFCKISVPGKEYSVEILKDAK